MKQTSVLALSIFLITALFSCAGDSENKIDETVIEPIPVIDIADYLGMNDGDVRMFTMPTPLQVSTTLKLMDLEYNNQILLPHNTGFKSDIEMAMGLGAYVVDLGYTTVYGNYQEGINYAQDVEQIMGELNISHYVSNAFMERFKNNADNQDSLCKIILSSYEKAHTYFNQDEGTGLLILTGAYIEGLYYTTESTGASKWKEESTEVLKQQEAFLDNFILLLSGYGSNSKIMDIVNEFKKLKTTFSGLGNYTYLDEDGNHVEETPDVKSANENIKKKVAELRKKLLIVG